LRGRVSRRNNNDDKIPNYMNMKHLSMISVGGRKSPFARLGSFALGVLCVSGFVESSLAQGTIFASATLTEVGTAGSEFEYSLTLDNTGTVPINSLWYGWVQGSFDLPSVPTSIISLNGWSGVADGDSIQFENGTGSAIPAGGFGTFTFETTSGPAAMTSGTTDGAPTGASVAYGAANGPSTFGENGNGSSGPIVPTLTTVPEPSTLGLMATGLTGMSFWMAKRRSKA
jgi:hypothetical protein